MFRSKVFAGLLLVLGLFLSMAFVSAPGTARAAVQDECGQDNEIDAAVTSMSAQVAKRLAIATNNVISQYGTIDISEAHCLKRLKTFYDALLALRIGNLDPFAFLMDMVIKQVVSILEQLCNQIVQQVGNLKDYVLSQINRICIPVPNLSANLTLPQYRNASCDGVPAFSFTPAPDYIMWGDYKPEKMIKEK